MTLNHKAMLEAISKLVNTDFIAEMDGRLADKKPKFTQKEAIEMADILGKVYLISHAIYCSSCAPKWSLPVAGKRV